MAKKQPGDGTKLFTLIPPQITDIPEVPLSDCRINELYDAFSSVATVEVSVYLVLYRHNYG